MLYVWEKPEKPSTGKIAYLCWEYTLTILLVQGIMDSHYELQTILSARILINFHVNELGNSSPSSKKFSLRVMVGLWLLMMVVVINAYTGTLTSFLTVPKLETTIDTFEQLIARNKKLITEKGAYLDGLFLVAYISLSSILWYNKTKFLVSPRHLVSMNGTECHIWNL